MQSGGGADAAARISMELMGRAARTGVPAIAAATEYAGQAVDQGLPKFVDRGYRAAETAALEQAVGETQARRVAALTGKKFNPNLVSTYAGSAQELAKEKAGIAVSKAAAGVSQRNQMLNILMGAGASSTDLSTSFGALTNRGLAAGLSGGNPAYEGVVGGVAGVTPLLLELLSRKQAPPSLSYQGNRGGYHLSLPVTG